MISLAYRLNPTLPLTLAGALLTAAEARGAPTALERAAQGLVIAFTVLLATAAYYLGIGDANTANKLAQRAYYALAGAVLTLLADTAIHSRP